MGPVSDLQGKARRLSPARRVPHTWNRWKRFWWAFRRAWRFAQGRYEIAEMTRQQERAFDRSVEKALSTVLRTK
jgi:hypothetical protein